MLVMRAMGGRERILCAREFQSSIEESVYRLLVSVIVEMGLDRAFDVQKTSIRCVGTGSEFIFKGLRLNMAEIKSLEGITICWVEEAQAVSASSWETLIPTIRVAGSEIWISFNPLDEEDPTFQFVVNPPPGAVVVEINWRDNPWFPRVLDDERRHMLRTDPDAYDNVWEGKCRRISSATILRGKYEIRAFETPPEHLVRFYHGADWGFSQDPTVLVRCWIDERENNLMIDYEAYAVGCDIDKTPELFDRVPTARRWPIKADCARPETISYMRGQGFNISAADKWPGCVEDGIAHLRGFNRIVIHERCEHTAREARRYSYKVDRRTSDVLPQIVDSDNHCIDALRYSLDGYIQQSGNIGIWKRLASQ